VEADARLLGCRFPVRATAIDLGGATWVHSPVSLGPELRTAIAEALPPIRFVIAPNRWHHLFAGEWAAAYPQAELHGAPGLAEKRPDLRFSSVLGDAPPSTWAGSLEQLIFSPMPIFNEAVFFHRVTRTLLLTDLVFNLQQLDWSPFGIYIRLAGGYRHFGPSRVSKRFIRDRARARELIDRILAWPFERVLMSHGDIVEENGRERLRSAFAWL
jgi:hypothetical protein